MKDDKRDDLDTLRNVATIDEVLSIWKKNRENFSLGSQPLKRGDLVRVVVNDFFIRALRESIECKEGEIPCRFLAHDRYELFLSISSLPDKLSGEWGDYKAVLLYRADDGGVAPAYEISIPRNCSCFMEMRHFKNPEFWLRTIESDS